ncbi:hypothetical protein [Methanoregula sp.]|uniref:hypothetical protein n=1 Tax=Methanoregula sp. TaxID=2052170 RepID=UPI002C1833F0|nr:hypothetical protein [Methanoregula sp.]HVP97619.1 hypothetical protein [Methanoregula sp.]
MCDMYSDVHVQFILFLIVAVFVGIISAAVSWLLLRDKRRSVRVSAVVALTILSFIAFYFRDSLNSPLWEIVVLFIAILWFPAAITLAGLVVPGVPGTKSLPVWILVNSVLVYLIEIYFDAYIADMLGLRSIHSLILIPPPSLPYEWLQIPEIYKVFIQFGVTFVLAALIFWLGLKLNRWLSGKTEGEPAS